MKTQKIQDGVKNLLNAAQVNTCFLQLLRKLNTEITCSHSHHAGAQLEEKNQPSAHLHNPRKLLQSSKEWLERRRNRTHRKGLRCPNSVIIPKPLIYFPFQNVIRFTGEKKEKHHFLKCLKLKRNKKQNLHSKCT